jgi:hypothetical protein
MVCGKVEHIRRVCGKVDEMERSWSLGMSLKGLRKPGKDLSWGRSEPAEFQIEIFHIQVQHVIANRTLFCNKPSFRH